MIRVSSQGVRDVIPNPESDERCAIRVFMEPNREGTGNFYVLWWFDDYCVDCKAERTNDVSAHFDRETLTELLNEIQRALDEDIQVFLDKEPLAPSPTPGERA